MGTQQTIRIERGQPDDVELAALVAALTGVLARRPVRQAPARAAWCVPPPGALRPATAHRRRQVRRPAHMAVRPRPSTTRTRTRGTTATEVAA